MFDLTGALHDQMTGLKYERVGAPQESYEHLGRLAKRVATHLIIKVTMPDKTVVEGLTTDLSETGVKLKLLDATLQKGDVVDLELTLPRKQNSAPPQCIHLKAKVMRIDQNDRQDDAQQFSLQKISYGLMFLNAEQNQDAINRCIQFFDRA